MEKLPEENLQDIAHGDYPTTERNTVEPTAESLEPKIDHWEMVKVMREFGFTDINEHPLILKHPNLSEMRDQDFKYGIDTNDRNETVLTVWKDGYCWARKVGNPQTYVEKIEKKLGRTLWKGAIQPRNLVFEHTDLA